MKDSFFKVVNVPEFYALLERFGSAGDEEIGCEQSAGRICSQTVFAPHDLPMFNRSCMDGYAVHAQDTFGAGELNPAYVELDRHWAIDEIPEGTLESGSCAGITTGGSMPAGADSVVMVEYTHEMEGKTVEVRRSVVPGENVMLKGEDVQTAQEVLAAGKRIRPQDVGILAALGVTGVRVFNQVRVAIISSGDELIPIDADPKPGQIRDVNSWALAAMVDQAGHKAVPYGIVRDDLGSLIDVLKNALQETDIVFISGGSSVGTRDLTVQAMQELGDSEILAHGVSISPGKPTILARIGAKPVVGLPGQVTSAQVVMLALGMPLLRKLEGSQTPFSTLNRVERSALLDRNLASKQGREDYVRVRLQEGEDGVMRAIPITGKSGLLRTMLQADGLVIVDAAREGLCQGEMVSVWVLKGD